MRDEIEARIWIAHHSAFSDLVGRAAAVLGAGLRRLARLRTRSP